MKNKLIAALVLTFLCASNSQLSTARAQSPFGNALDFNGSNQYVTVPTAAGSAVNSPFTIEAWVYVRAYASWSRLMDFGNGAGTDNIVCALSSDVSGQPRFSFWNGSGGGLADLISPSPLPLNAWTHLAFTYDGTNGSIFINGDLAASGPMTAPPIVTRANNFIGRSNWPDPYANAVIDEFRIWSVARSPAQIQASRSAPLVGNEAGLLLYYKFDSASGTVATNSATATGAAYNGTLVNSPGWVPGSTPPSSLVTNTSDAGAGSLREAINTTPPGGFIYFATNLSGQTITLTNGQLEVTNKLTLDASALTGGLTLSGAGSRLLLITNNATVVLKSLTLYNGRAVGGTNNFGGGIYNSTNCTLTVTRCLLSGNSASGGNGNGGTPGPGGIGSGGAIYNAGTLTLDNCTVSSNSASGGLPITSNPGGDGRGGGIYNAGTVTLDNCTLSGNSASGGNGGSDAPGPGGNGSGGGIYNAGTATLGYCTVSSNSVSGGDGSSCCGSGQAGGSGSGGGLYNGGALTLNNCTLSTNGCSGGKGGNGAGSSAGVGGNVTGGGVHNGGTLTLNQNTLSGNSTTGGSGGVAGCNCAGGAGGKSSGGGVYNGGTLTFNQNTLSGNSATSGSGGPGPMGNGAAGAADGGGIYNTATNATLRNCLIALNAGGSSPDLSGSFISQGHNLVGATNGSAGILGGLNSDLAGTTAAALNPMLSPLANYGGPTLTLALQPGSPAIEAGDDSVTNTFATDQRGPGFSRRFLQHVDIGAYEFGNGGSAPTITSLSAGSVTLNTATYLGSLTVGASVNPNAIDAPATAWVEYGGSTVYGLTTTPVSAGTGTNYVPRTRPLTNLAPGLTWHYRWVAANFFGTNFSLDQSVNVGIPGANVLSGVVGDVNGDGLVSQAELDRVYASYVTNSPWLYMTNMAGLGGTNVTFSLSNSVLGAYSIQYSTNLVNWYYLGPATPRYFFTDTNAPALPKRYYRLSYP